MKNVPYDFYWGVCERGVANNDTLEQMFTTRDKAEAYIEDMGVEDGIVCVVCSSWTDGWARGFGQTREEAYNSLVRECAEVGQYPATEEVSDAIF